MTWHVLPGKHAVWTDLPLPPALLDGVPHRRSDRVIVAKHDQQTWQQLKDRGVTLPSPMVHYDWPGQWTPRQNQKRTAAFLAAHRKAICLNGMRVGKTLSAIWAADFLHRQGAVRRMLVIAPLSTHVTVWERNYVYHLPHKRVALLHGPRERKQRIAADTRIEVLVVNPESLGIVADYLQDVDLVVVDEATAFKNARSKRWKLLNGIVKQRHARLWLMTASPTPQSPEDAYGLLRLLHPEYISMRQWRDMTMVQVSTFKWVPKQTASQTVARWLQPSIRYTLADCGDVPTVQYEDIKCGLSKQQKAVLEDLKKSARAEFADKSSVTATNAAALLSKMLQVQAGGVYGLDTEDRRTVQAIPADDYFRAITEFVSEADTPVLVFAPFRSAAVAIEQHLREKAGLPTALVHGDVKREARNEAFNAVQAGTVQALVAVPSTMSHGLTLNRASYVLWAAPPFKAEEYSQANGRVLEAASNKHIVVAHIVPSKLATELYGRLKSKAQLQDTVLKLLDGEL